MRASGVSRYAWRKSLVAGIALFVLLSLGATTARGDTYVYQRNDSLLGNLYVQEDGEAERRLPFQAYYPELAPDGKRIVFADKETSALKMTDLEGHGPHQIMPPNPQGKFMRNDYSWAPNGGGLVVTHNENIVEIRPTADSLEWEITPLVTWPGIQGEPIVSPDGSKIAFVSYHNSLGEAYVGESPKLFIADRDGSDIELVTVGSHHGLSPTFSPSGERIAIGGFSSTKDPDSEIYAINVSTHAVTQLTNNSVEDWAPDWRADGRIAYRRSSSYRIMDDNGANDEQLKSFSGTSPFSGPSFAAIEGNLPNLNSESKEEASALLRRYAPKLRYDTMESFPTMSAASMTDVYSLGIESNSNRLLRANGNVIAFSDPALDNPRLSLDFLSPPFTAYPNEKLVNGEDRLSQHGNDEEDAAIDIFEMAEDPDYANLTYGRAKYGGGRWWLQYWVWSYYQSFLEGWGNHEGDWEFVQIGIDQNGRPEIVTLGQHSGGESCTWGDLGTSIGYYGNLAPDVFVSWGVHASYSSMDAVDGFGEFTDAEVPVAPRIVQMKDADNWVEWPGQWGDSESSPGAPSTQGSKWGSPDKFDEEAGGCEAEAPAARRSAEILHPEEEVLDNRLQARRIGDRVRVDYDLKGLGAEQVRSLLVTVSEAEGAPIGRVLRDPRRSGSFWIDIPFGDVPLIARARALAADGSESAISEVVVAGS